MNSDTPRRLHTVESAEQSVWDTVKYNFLSDTGDSDSVWASDS